MTNEKPRLRYIFLIFSILLMLSGIAIAGTVQNNMGSVFVTEVSFQAADGSNIHSTLQQPAYATSSSPLPGVIVFHGSLQNKEWLMAFGIELARRGFVVLTPDANGHGNSDDGSGSGPAALEYMTGLDYVDSSAIGLVGHSIGGGTAASALSGSSINIGAVVLVGSWVRPDWNSTYPSNLLVTVGDFDSLSSIPRNATPLEPAFGITDIQEDVTYGDFDSDSARQLTIARTNHLFETIDPEIVSETVEWMKDSLKGGVEDSNWISASDLVYGWWLTGGFIATLGSATYSATKGTLRKWGLIYSVIPPLTFFPLILLGTFVPFPQNYGAAISLWFLGTALILYLLLRYALKGKEGSGLDMKTFWRAGSEGEDVKKPLLKTFLLALVVVLWLYLWTLFVDLGLALDFRCFLPGMNDLTVSRALLVPFYAVMFFIYFMIDGMWLMGPLRPANSESWYRGQINWSLTGMLVKGYPFAILIGFEFGLGMLLGTAVVP
ncbi:MAG: alpha/beta hydrolase, partial [Candidatus Thorarchaeota archaeon]